MTLVALLMAIAVTVWSVVLLRYGSIMAVSLVLLLAGTLFGPAFLHFDGPFQVSSERVLFCALIPFAIVHWRLGWTDPKPLSRGDWLLVAFTAFLAISACQGGATSESGSTIARWLFYVAMPTTMYFVLRGSRIQKSDLTWLCTFMLGLGCYLACMAGLEALKVTGLVFPRYIVDPEIWEFYGRARGPLLNPSANGILMSAALGVAISRFFTSQLRAGRIGYAALALLNLAGCYFTLTRCVWLGAAVIASGLVFIRLPRTVQVWVVATTIIFAVLGGTSVSKSLMKLKRDENLSAEASLQSIQLRPLLAVMAWEMFKDKPLRGHGFGHYLDHNSAYVHRRQWNMPLETASNYIQHNIILSMLVDTGLIGCGMYVSLLLWWSVLAGKLRRRLGDDPVMVNTSELFIAILVAYGINGMFQDATIFPMIHMFLMSIAGICTGVWIRGGYAVSDDRDHHGARRQTTSQPRSRESVPNLGWK